MASPATAKNIPVSAGERRWLPIALTVFLALLMGVMVAEGQWLLVAALAAAPLVFLWPVQVALGAFALLIPFDSATFSQGDGNTGTTLNFVVGAAAASILIVTALAGNRLQRPPRAAFWWTLLIMWYALTYLWAVDPRASMARLPTAAACLVLYLAATSLRVREAEFKVIVTALIVGGCLAGMYSSYEFYHHIGWGTARSSLVMGEEAINPNIFATRLLLPLALSVGAFFSVRSALLKTLLVGCSALLTLAVLLTLSRGAALAVLVMAVVFLLRFGVNRRILAGGALIAGITLALPKEFFTRFGQAAKTGGAGRLDIWYVAVEALKHYGVFGAGLSNFSTVYTKYAGYAPRFVGFDRASHNLYLEMSVEAGIIGLLLLVQAIRMQLGSGNKSKRPAGKPNPWMIAVEAASWSILTAALFAHLFWEKSFWFLWIMVAFAAQLFRNNYQSTERVQPKSTLGVRRQNPAFF